MRGRLVAIVIGIIFILVGINSIFKLPHGNIHNAWAIFLIVFGILFLLGVFSKSGSLFKPSVWAIGVGVVMVLIGINAFYPLPHRLYNNLWGIFIIIVGIKFVFGKKIS